VELKAAVGELIGKAESRVDNDQLKKLTDAVTSLINRQKQQAASQPTSYAAALRAGLPAWSLGLGLPRSGPVPARPPRELVVAIPNASSQD
jgi:hypothetical protein